LQKIRHFINNIPQSRFTIYVILLSMYIKTDRNVALYLCFLFQLFYPSLPLIKKTDSIIGFYGYFVTRQNIRIQTGRCGRDRMAVGFTTTRAINAYHPCKVVSSNPVHGEVYSVQHYVIKFVSDLRHKLVVFSGYSGILHQ